MRQLVSVLLLVIGLCQAEPQQGYNYQAPSNPLTYQAPQQQCPVHTSVVYSTAVQQRVIPTTLRNVQTQYRTTTVYSQRVVPQTQYRTRVQTIPRVQTSYVESQTAVQREQVVTRTNRGQDSYQTRYETSVRVIPQVNYVTQTRYESRVVPVERTSTRYQTQYRDQVQYQTVPVQRTSVLQVPGRDVVQTQHRTQYQTSFVQRPGATQTQNRFTTLVQYSTQVQSIPSPPVVSTQVQYRESVIATTQVRTRYQTQYVTQTRFVTRTNYQTQFQVQTRYQTREVVVTRDVPREVVRTQFTTQVIPTTQVQNEYRTQYRTGRPVFVTQTSYYQSVVQVPGQDRVVSQEVVNTQFQNQIVYSTRQQQQQVTVTRTITQQCQQEVGGGYNYPEPANQLTYG